MRLLTRPTWPVFPAGRLWSPVTWAALTWPPPPSSRDSPGLHMDLARFWAEGAGLKVPQRVQFSTKQIHTGAAVAEVGAQTAPPNRGLGPETRLADDLMGNSDSGSPLSASPQYQLPPPLTPGTHTHRPRVGSPRQAAVLPYSRCAQEDAPCPQGLARPAGGPRAWPTHSPFPSAPGTSHTPGRAPGTSWVVCRPGHRLPRPRTPRGSRAPEQPRAATC